jgi:anti-sigma factor RsiW
MSDPRELADLLAASGTDEVDAGCAAGFEVLHRYVESELAGGHPAGELPGLAAHLSRCPACRADHAGLVEAVRMFGDPGPGAG